MTIIQTPNITQITSTSSFYIKGFSGAFILFQLFNILLPLHETCTDFTLSLWDKGMCYCDTVN